MRSCSRFCNVTWASTPNAETVTSSQVSIWTYLSWAMSFQPAGLCGTRDPRLTRNREQTRRGFDHLVDDGEQMMSVVAPLFDILGYGPIRTISMPGISSSFGARRPCLPTSPEK